MLLFVQKTRFFNLGNQQLFKTRLLTSMAAHVIFAWNKFNDIWKKLDTIKRYFLEIKTENFTAR